jgi:hypothetical protein
MDGHEESIAQETRRSIWEIKQRQLGDTTKNNKTHSKNMAKK